MNPKRSAVAKKIKAPQFSYSFLMPKYWLIWLGVIILFLIIQLPYPIIRKLGNAFGMLLPVIAKKRTAISKRNIQLCFPQWSEQKQKEIYQQNLLQTGNALFETAMAWWWPDWRVKKHFKVEGYEKVRPHLEKGVGVFALAVHNLSLEMGCRGLGYTHKCISFYRKHNNPLIDYLQYHGRVKSNDFMIDKRSARLYIEALNSGELCIYFPDQDYGKKQSLFVPFGGVEKAATTTGTLMFAERSNSFAIVIIPQYTKTGWLVRFSTELDYLADKEVSSPHQRLTRLNIDLLNAIKMQPESYLWMHKRFKSRPDDEPKSLY